MNREDIFDGVTDIRDDLVEGAKKAPKKQKWGKRWLGAAAAVMVVVILGNLLLRPGLKGYAITQAEYPKMAPYPSGVRQYSEKAYSAWWEDYRAQRRELGDTSDLEAFFTGSAQTFLTDAPGQNRIYSPLNVYMALSMLAQTTGGNSREQLLSLLGSGDMDTLRQRASDVWNACYRDDGAATTILASSLWLNENVSFRQDTMDTLARDFYASSFRGEMGSAGFDKALQTWLDEQTGGLLKRQTENIRMDSSTILALATTVYFQAKWSHQFSGSKTAPRTFHTPAGDVDADFMNQRDDQLYYWGEKFAAIEQHFTQGGSMWFLLPDEGVTPEELLKDAEAARFLFSGEKSQWENQKHLFVNKAIPKFDVSSQLDLGEGLKALGITDIFDAERSDFTSLTTDADLPIVLSQANHAARVVIDEEGCTAAAFTELSPAGAAPPPDEEVDFVLDRPFVFCITGESGLPLFVGVVNSPN